MLGVGEGEQLLVAVLLGEPEEARRCRFGIELDEYRRLVTDDPGVVPRLNDHHLRCDELEGAAIGVLTTYVAQTKPTCAYMQSTVPTSGFRVR